MRVENPQSFRENVAETFKITFGITEDHLAKNIEISIFNYTLNESGKKKIVKKWENKYFVQLYVNRFRTLINNMKNNEELLESIKGKKLSKKALENLSHHEMNPSIWRSLIEAKIVVNISGDEVPKAIIVDPIMKGEILNLLEVNMAYFSRASAAFHINKMPMLIKRKVVMFILCIITVLI